MGRETDKSRYTLSELKEDEATEADLKHMSRMMCQSRAEEPVWRMMMGSASQEEEEQWFMDFWLRKMIGSPGRSVFILRENSTG